MSLINEALKKAQKERALQEGKSRKSLLQESDAPGHGRGGAERGNSGLPLIKLMFGLVIAGSTLASAIAFMVFLFIQVQDKSQQAPAISIDSPPAPPTVTINPNRSTPVTPKEEPEPTSNPVALSNQSLSQNLENAPTLTANRLPAEEPATSTPESDPVSEPIEPAAPTQESATALSKPNPESAPPDLDPGLTGSSKDPYATSREPPQPETLSPQNRERIEDYIRNASVTGIRLSGPDSKVVLNNKVYRLQELVLDFDLYLRVVGIQKRQVIFEDEYGSRYTKRF